MQNKDRFETVKREVWDRLAKLRNGQQLAIIHLSGVASLCGLIAMRRKLDPEICQTAGLLHDLWLYCNFPLDLESHKKHGDYGSAMAREIFNKVDMYEQEEIELICQMISLHDNKSDIDSEYDEVLKDADAFQHLLNNSEYDKKYEFYGRERKLIEEFGIEMDFD